MDNNVSDDDTTVAEMRFSDDGSTWGSWEPFAGSKNWSLSSGDGQKTVYAQFRNTVHMTTTISDTIILDTTAPTVSASSPDSTMSLSFSVDWSGDDAGSGVDSFDVQYRVGSGGAWTDWLTDTTATSADFGPHTPEAVQRGETYYFRVRARETAGNDSSYAAETYTGVDSLHVYLPATRSP